ncbi:MAG: hypothetical protein IGS48_17065 [Oscillatoriales cyanobacterium C42_A2020_001]|nr:hypothetical protein [Leptolyngbyaceae cyanobacterium C42_A2020_001]
MPTFEEVRKFIGENWELLLFALGGVEAIIGVVYAVLKNWHLEKQRRKRQQRIPVGDFPFLVLGTTTLLILRTGIGGLWE